MEYSKGKWGILKEHHEIYIQTDKEPVCYCHELNSTNLSNANLIASAVNACIEINPDNPQAVAEAIPEIFEALKRFLGSSACKNKCKPNDMTCDTNFARRAIAKVEEK